jgi:hypothetical protein
MPDIYDLADEFRKALLARERAAASEMVRYYGAVWGRLSVLIDDALAEFDRSGGQATGPGWTLKYERLRALRSQVEGEMRNFVQFAGGKIETESVAAVQAAMRDAENVINYRLTQVNTDGIFVGWNRLPRSAVENMVGTFQDGSPLRDLLDKLPDEGGKVVMDGLVTGLALGKSPMAIALEIRKGLGNNLVRALRISRTEVLRSYREATRQSYLANSDVVAGWVWLSAMSGRTCAACWAMHGTEHKLSERLDDHPGGRCTPIPLLTGEKGIIQTGAEEFEKLSEERQLAILGPGKFAAYKDGKITLQDLVGRKVDSRWGSMRYERSLRDVLGKEGARKYRSAMRKKGPPGDGVSDFDVENKKVKIGPSRVFETIDEAEKKIAKQTFETAAVFTPDGEFLFARDGNAIVVGFSDNELNALKGNVLVHNHPSGKSISPADVATMIKWRISELRVVTDKKHGAYRYLMRPSSDLYSYDMSEINPVLEEIHADLKRTMLQLIEDGIINEKRTEIDMTHEIWFRVDNYFDHMFGYDREEIR